MPELKAFKGIFAEDKYKEHFAIRSLDNYTKEEIEKLISSTKTTFLDIIYPTIDKTNWGTVKRYERVRKNYESFLNSNKIIEDRTASIYIYEQTYPSGKIFTGFLCLLSLEDFKQNKIKKHEATLKAKKELFATYLEKVHIQAEPTLITYTESHKLDLMMDLDKKGIPLLKITDSEGVLHKVWKVDNRLQLQQFKEVIGNLDSLYIADGHHRMGSTSLYRESQKAQDEEYLGNEPYNYILSYVIPSHSLTILEYNRLITDLNGLTKEEFLKKLETAFTIINKGDKAYYPSKKFHLSMYLDDEFYALYIKPEFRGVPEGLGELDTFLFQELVLKPILNIQDSRNDIRISYEKGTGNMDGILSLKSRVDSGEFSVAFGFFPMSFSDMKLISDLDLKMPPKSTYIEPKLLSGLMMYKMK